ncbi:MAG: hypothetical protein WCP29_14480 [Acidobacteriota bacterium]
MRRTLAIQLVLLIGLQPAWLSARQADPQAAQTPRSEGRPRSASPTQPPVGADSDIAALGMSFDRIKRILADQAPSTGKTPLKLNYYVEVVALAPIIQLFSREDLAPTGPMPWGAPTHADIVRQLTPVAFRSPGVPIGALAIVGIMKLAQWEAARARRQKAEEDRRQRDDEERARQKALQESGLIVKHPA